MWKKPKSGGNRSCETKLRQRLHGRDTVSQPRNDAVSKHLHGSDPTDFFLFTSCSISCPFTLGMGFGLLQTVPAFTLMHVGLRSALFSHNFTGLHLSQTRGGVRAGPIGHCEAQPLSSRSNWNLRIGTETKSRQYKHSVGVFLNLSKFPVWQIDTFVSGCSYT